MKRAWGMLLVGCLLSLSFAQAAPPTPAQKKELAAIKAAATKVGTLIKKKQADEAEAALTDVESRLAKWLEETSLKSDDAPAKPVVKVIETQKKALAKLQGKAPEGTVSFAKDLAPIVQEKCVGCHGADNPRNRLRLDTFAGWQQGGASGPLLVIGQPEQSLLFQRLMAPNPQFRMPRGQPGLSIEEVQKFAIWIAEGANFDGADPNNDLRNLDRKPAPPVKVEKATGNEKISFIRDVAPTLVNVCTGCHNDNNRGGGLSMVTFEKLLQGGDTSPAITPASLEQSRLWRLVNADEEPVMPRGQARITRKWHGDLKTWILEGAKFDGPDAKRPLRQLIPSDEEVRRAELAKLSPEEWKELRIKQTTEQWSRTFPNAEPQTITTDEFYIVGDVPAERLKQVEQWANVAATTLKTNFQIEASPIWTGRLAIFVFKDRFGYEEFNSTIQQREVPREVLGHSQVTPNGEEAFIALQDIGDEASGTSPGLELSVVEHLVGAYLKKGGPVPEWLVRGAGGALVGQKLENREAYFLQQRTQASQILRASRIQNPAELFANGTFSPSDVGPVGFTLVDFLLRQGGPAALRQLIGRLQQGEAVEAALQSVYNTPPAALATAFAGSLTGGR